MRQKILFLQSLSALLLILVYTNIVSAQQLQSIQISPDIQALQRGQAPAGPALNVQTDDKQRIARPGPEQPAAYSQSAAESMEEVSDFEQFIAGEAPLTISTRLKQFGYDLFKGPPSSFAASADVPVGPDYVLGPEDEVRIMVWGKVEGTWNAVVDRDGNISLPKLGVFGVAGLTFSELKGLLRKEMSRYYTGFEMNVSMGSLRSIKVYVVGNAANPGAYSVSSLSTLVNALMVSGGPGKTGSMRDIQLKRNGRIVTHFDMYDFLLQGDKTKDVRLVSEDVIFIPTVGPMAGIAGHVKRPAIYELQKETRLLDLISMAGGLSSTAFKGRLQVQRTEGHQFRTMFEGDLINIENNPDKNFALQDGDLVKVFSIVDTINTVRLEGAVVSVGEYAIIPGETRLSSVIAKAGGLLYYASDQAELTRVSVTQSGPVTELLQVDISKALKGDPEHDLLMKVNDFLLVRTVPGWKLYSTISINGEVKYPGTYTIRAGETLSSLIERAGGFTDKAYLRGAVFTREAIRDLQQARIAEMIVRIENDLLAKGAVGTSIALSVEEAKIKELEIGQKLRFVDKLKTVKAKGRMALALSEPEILKNTPYDIILSAGDRLYIPSNPQSIQVLGAVFNRTAFVYEKGRNLESYVALAGGYTDSANKKKVYILKVDGTAVRTQGSFSAYSWNDQSNQWEYGYDGVEPGDTIVVPEKLEKIAWMREIKDLTQILYQIAVTAGVLIVAF